MFKATLGFTLSPFKRSFSASKLNLAGHNKWSKIKQKKGIMDAQKGAIYGRISRDIVLAVRNGGSVDPNLNLHLASALKRAKEQHVPKENVERALAKATGGKDRTGESLTYEALAHNSVGLIIECLTNNTNRTIHRIREVLTAHNARFTPVKFMFVRQGYVRVCLDKCADTRTSVDEIVDVALEGGAEDFEQLPSDHGVTEVEFSCQPNALAKVTTAVTTLPFCELLNSELVYAPIQCSQTSNEIESEILDLVDELEADEDTLRVWTSLDN
ncbi:hypothetical protein APHAL10511_007012 [Amanita phalloides]|nr:hypothetical protein APHAL10511_007012 [Amanita phalloides]